MSDPSDKVNDAIDQLDLEKRYSDWQSLGQGGMGKVFVAHDEMLDKKVAIKLLHGDVDTRAVVRFQQEAKVLSKLSHKFIVRIWDFHYSKSGQLFLVMEHVDGSSLESILEETGRLPAEETLRIAIQLSQALKHAHAQGIIHRDLKPANVMLDSERNAKILDFGIAKLVSSSEIFGTLTKVGQLIGSPLYMSPEQLRGEAASELSDVYGLGLLVFTMISGHPPFAGSNLMESLQQRLAESVPSLQPYIENPKFCRGFDAIIARALHPDQDQRLANMAQFDEELSALQVATADAISDTEVNPSIVLKSSSIKPLNFVIGAFVVLFLAVTVLYFALKDKLPPTTAVQPVSDTDSLLSDSMKVLKPSDRPRMLKRIEPIAGFTSGPAGFWKPTNTTITEDDLKRLRASAVQSLALANNRSVTGKTLAQLPIAQLKALNLRNTSINDEDLEQIGKMTKLIWLSLSGTEVTDRGIEHLQQLKELHRLDLKNCTGITDQVIPKLLKIPTLQNLHLDETRVTRDGVVKLQELPRLYRAGFAGLDVTDEDIKGFRHLDHIDLSGCKNITDETLLHFARKRKFVAVIVDRCPRVSKNGIRTLREAHPAPKPNRVNNNRVNANDVNDVGDTFFDE